MLLLICHALYSTASGKVRVKQYFPSRDPKIARRMQHERQRDPGGAGGFAHDQDPGMLHAAYAKNTSPCGVCFEVSKHFLFFVGFEMNMGLVSNTDYARSEE
jgi:hypothetical protein